MKKENAAETPNDVEDEEAYLARALEECIHKVAPSLNNEET